MSLATHYVPRRFLLKDGVPSFMYVSVSVILPKACCDNGNPTAARIIPKSHDIGPNTDSDRRVADSNTLKDEHKWC
jgi:hypothetical protein